MANRSPGLQQKGGLQAHKPQSAALLQLLTFKVGTLNLAFPIQSVYKVTHYEAVYGTGLGNVGITQIDNLEVMVVDLHQRVLKSDSANQPKTDPCLIIVQGQSKEFCGVPADNTPTLLEIPPAMVRVLPEAYRRADTLDIASHVAVTSHENTKLTIFVLDVNQLLKNPNPLS